MYHLRQTKNKELIKELHKKIFPQDEFYEHKNNIFWVLKHSKKPIGFCIATDIGSNIVFFSRAGLLNCATGKGLHLKMIKNRLVWAQKQGFERAITYVDIDNVPSARNLLKCGFELYRPDWDYVGRNYNYFMKSL